MSKTKISIQLDLTVELQDDADVEATRDTVTTAFFNRMSLQAENEACRIIAEKIKVDYLVCWSLDASFSKAPDLYEALEEAQAYIVGARAFMKVTEDSPMLKRISSALAKARGEQQ